MPDIKEGSINVAHIPWIPEVTSIVKRLVFAKRMMFKAMDIAILNMKDISDQLESGSPEEVKGAFEYVKETMPMGIQNISQEDANISQLHDELKTIKLKYHKGAYNQGATTWGIYDSPDVNFGNEDIIGCRIGIKWQPKGKGDWSTDVPGKPWWGVIRLTCEYNVKTKKTEWNSHVRNEYERADDEKLDDYVERSVKELSTKHEKGWSYADEGEDFIVKEAPSVLTFVQKVLNSKAPEPKAQEAPKTKGGFLDQNKNVPSIRMPRTKKGKANKGGFLGALAGLAARGAASIVGRTATAAATKAATAAAAKAAAAAAARTAAGRAGAIVPYSASAARAASINAAQTAAAEAAATAASKASIIGRLGAIGAKALPYATGLGTVASIAVPLGLSISDSQKNAAALAAGDAATAATNAANAAQDKATKELIDLNTQAEENEKIADAQRKENERLLEEAKKMLEQQRKDEAEALQKFYEEQAAAQQAALEELLQLGNLLAQSYASPPPPYVPPPVTKPITQPPPITVPNQPPSVVTQPMPKPVQPVIPVVPVAPPPPPVTVLPPKPAGRGRRGGSKKSDTQAIQILLEMAM